MAAAEQPEDDDALFVLTAAMLTPARFPGVLGDDYPAACRQLGLEPLAEGYGLVFGQDGGGARWTVATTDCATVACALAAWDCGLEYDLAPDENSMAASLPGWPLPVAVAVPDIPAPHDPPQEGGTGPALAPPDISVWGPPQRRLGADEIAVRWHEWRDQLGDGAGAREPEPPVDGKSDDTASAVATPDAGEQPPAAPDPRNEPGPDAESDREPAADQGAGAGHEPPAGPAQEPAEPAPSPPALSHDGVRRALLSAEEYLRTPPPPGRVRTTSGTLRADGPGWSLVARADDIAFVLLDEAPGEVLPVGRGPALPPLLEALSRLAAPQV
ncbi:hypothetical protein [Streptomyces sp. CA-111067]|uniref:hypothetical protein n=1 Tax=Streptomyces sp. CA-111067 TaxID=3240046 RepID=UPI003D97F463